MQNATQDVSGVVTLNDDHKEAALLNCSVSFLRKDRRNRKIIPFLRLSSGVIRYDHARVLQALLVYEEGGVAPRKRKAAAAAAAEVTAMAAG